MICVAQPVFQFFQSENTLYLLRCGGCKRGTKHRLMQSWNFPYIYNIPTYFAYIDGISHSFKHKLHDKQGVKVI